MGRLPFQDPLVKSHSESSHPSANLVLVARIDIRNSAGMIGTIITLEPVLLMPSSIVGHRVIQAVSHKPPLAALTQRKERRPDVN
ncbi:MAG: hypothetical protein OER56_09645 [Hyphomicrobiales bacterium]|nr:hypothetical protein [Hyphomicrobiales bacterium]